MRKDKERAALHAAAVEAQKILDEGDTLFSAGIDPAPLRELATCMTTKPFLYVFNVDEDELGDEEFKDEQRALVAPAEAIFLDAKIEAELAELPTRRPPSCWQSRRARRSPASTSSPASASTPSACRPTSRPAPRSPAPGPSRRAPPPPRPPASSTPTSRRASSRPRSSPSTTWSRPARSPRPAPRARPAWRARTTSCRTATWWSSASRLSGLFRTEAIQYALPAVHRASTRRPAAGPPPRPHSGHWDRPGVPPCGRRSSPRSMMPSNSSTGPLPAAARTRAANAAASGWSESP